MKDRKSNSQLQYNFIGTPTFYSASHVNGSKEYNDFLSSLQD